MQFHLIASTGRTATTFLARAINNLADTAACHEGYVAADKDSIPILPLINLENRQAFHSPEAAMRIVAAKRSAEIIEEKAAVLGCATLVDIAYYNSTIGEAVLAIHPGSKMVAIIRDLEPFVRSATAIEGEDLLPVGWPDPEKPLTPRERFIEMGRIRPPKDSKDADNWDKWSAIMRNIWLWRETNSLLLKAKAKFGDRVLLMQFEQLQKDPEAFLGDIAAHLGIPADGIPAALEDAKGHTNRKKSGYQIGPITEWTTTERAFAKEAEEMIGIKL